MPALVNYRGDDYHTGGSLCSKDSNRSFSVQDVVYSPPSKRLRINGSYFLFFEEEKKPSIDLLPDECLYEIFRRLPGAQSRSASACVSKKWLTVLSSVKKSQIVSKSNDVEMISQENDGFLTRSLEGKKATDGRLLAIAVGTSARGGLGKLSVRGSDKVTESGFAAIARGCPSLKVLSLWNVPSIGDEALIEISKECQSLEKLDLCHCPLISNKGISAIAKNCPNLSSLTIESCKNIGNESLQSVARFCPNLESISIKDCPLIGDQGVAALMSSSPSLTLKKLKLQSLNITDFSLAVIGHYGKSISNLALVSLRNITQKGFWAMGNAKGLQSLSSLIVISCYGLTDLSLEALGNGCGFLKQMLLKKCCFVSDNGLISFAKSAENLESLQLEECNRISQKGIFGSLSNCESKLKSLTIVKCMGIQDFDQETSGLTQCGSLRSLTVKDCIGFGNTSLAIIGALTPQLQNLELSGLSGITDAGLFPVLDSCKSRLMKVNLSNCVNLTDKTVVDLAKIHGSTLKMLNLEGGKKFTDESLGAIAENCLLLNDLDVSKCCISDYGISCLSEGIQTELQILSVSGCSKISNKSIPALKKLGETLVGLNIQQCNSITSSAVDNLVENLWRCDILS